jgi:integrase
MASTRTPGITTSIDGRRFIDKRYRGIRIGMRVGAIAQEKAELRLHAEMQRIDLDFARGANPHPLFRDCAARYLVQSRHKNSIETIRIHVGLLMRHLGALEPQQIHDATLAPFIAARLAEGASATTVNRSLEVVRTILNRSARFYRDDNGVPLLNTLPPMITRLPETRRQPYPITWEEQDDLFPRLPVHLQCMVLFAVNTGLRDSNVCGLRWSWEVAVPEVGRSVFVIPPDAFKSRRAHVVILNDAAWSIIQTQRGLNAAWVFPLRGQPIGTMNNNGWQRARREAGLTQVRVHDLRHTFACRLRAAGVSVEDRAALLGHANRSIAGHYASADVGRLIHEANLVMRRQATCTVLRVANGAPLRITRRPTLHACE